MRQGDLFQTLFCFLEKFNMGYKQVVSMYFNSPQLDIQ